MGDVRAALLAERRLLLPQEDEAAARAWLATLGHRTPNELEALLARIRRTNEIESAMSWLETAGLGLARPLYDSALLMYRNSGVLSWEECLELARLLSWSQPNAFRDWNLTT
ncbi:MAG: hypothetical protein WCB04_02470 [Mycobacteriales bacterium]